MFRYERTTRGPGDASKWMRTLVHPELRVYVTGCTGSFFDYGLFQPAQELHDATRAHVQIILRGALHLERDGVQHTLTPGMFCAEEEMLCDERWEGPDFAALCVEWSHSLRTPQADDTRGLHVQRLPEEVLTALQECLDDWRAADATTLAIRLLDAIAPLGHSPTGLTRAQLEQNDPIAQQLLDALGWALSSLDEQPMWCDILTRIDLSERHLRRHITEVLGWLSLPDSDRSFRRALATYRLNCCVCFLSAPGVRVSDVASALGYSSSTALCTALTRGNMPTPRELQTSLARIQAQVTQRDDAPRLRLDGLHERA